MAIVTDTNILSSLAAADALAMLPTLFQGETFYLPPAVEQELKQGFISLVPTRLRGNAVRTRQRPVPSTLPRHSRCFCVQLIETHCHIRARDALHVASAILGKARYFLSADQKITQLTQAKCYRRLIKPWHPGYFSAMNPRRFMNQFNIVIFIQTYTIFSGAQ